MLAGVATRRHGDVAEPLGEDLEERSKSMSKSAVSRRFVAATTKAMDELMARNLADLDVAVLMIDGLDVAGSCVVVALVITTDGTKVPVGLWLGDTENKTVVTALLADLVARGLDTGSGVLCVIDGAKALAAGIKKVFGDAAAVQRCVLHKRRNVEGHLPTELAGSPRLLDRDQYCRSFDEAAPKRLGLAPVAETGRTVVRVPIGVVVWRSAAAAWCPIYPGVLGQVLALPFGSTCQR